MVALLSKNARRDSFLVFHFPRLLGDFSHCMSGLCLPLERMPSCRLPGSDSFRLAARFAFPFSCTGTYRIITPRLKKQGIGDVLRRRLFPSHPPSSPSAARSSRRLKVAQFCALANKSDRIVDLGVPAPPPGSRRAVLRDDRPAPHCIAVYAWLRRLLEPRARLVF